MNSFALHPEAFSDLDEIREYIARDSFDAADHVISQIFGAIRSLVPFPHQGHRRPDLTSRPLRFVPVHDYLIAYAPDEKPLWIIAVLHGRRSPGALSAILNSRSQPPQ